jgi:hypothetical protein
MEDEMIRAIVESNYGRLQSLLPPKDGCLSISVIHAACLLDDLPALQILVQRGMDNYRLDIAMRTACEKGHLEMVRYLYSVQSSLPSTITWRVESFGVVLFLMSQGEKIESRFWNPQAIHNVVTTIPALMQLMRVLIPDLCRHMKPFLI